ncbi:MAG: efflux transporter periplasmic adaptor subunit [Gallionellales bacterium RIFOXYB12_FULL_54_9]|nr:MAG: efflux transporter periplasmic adaptor subunit [Gallionellales bacterium RIFOXYB12_FULL_54_9]
MKNNLRIWLSLFLIIAAIAGYFAYRQYNFVPLEQQYQLQTLERGDLNQTVSANGTIKPVTLVNVGTQVSGTVKKLYVDYNHIVAKGQILLELDNALLSAQLKQDLANVQNATAALELMTANEARTRSLYNQEYASRLELDTAVQAKKSARAQLDLTNATVEKDRANLAYTVIRSPVSGVVVDRSVDVGQTVAASLQTPTLFKIAQDLSKMQIDANFAEADIASIRAGQPVKFTVDAYPNRNFQGEVRLVRLNPTNQQNVITYDVVINVSNPEQILMPGMTAYVSLNVAERKDVLIAPNAALRFKPSVNEKTLKNKNAGKKPGDDNKSGRYSGHVYVLRSGQLQSVTVKLGITDNRHTEIISGDLKAGEQVVTGETQTVNGAANSASMRPRMF